MGFVEWAFIMSYCVGRKKGVKESWQENCVISKCRLEYTGIVGIGNDSVYLGKKLVVL